MEKRSICLFVIGKKYENLYERLNSQFSRYAKKCHAELVIIREIPDHSFYRPLLSQKLLIPSLMKGYGTCLFLDLDILISEEAPCIFDQLPADKSFGAILDPRGTEEFASTWAYIPRILRETTADYFVERNFQENPNLLGSINGGVFIFRPKEVAEIFSDYYYSKHNQGELNSFEETPMAYLTQTQNTFQPIDIKFNTQVMYKLKGTESGKKVWEGEKRFPKFLRNIYYKRTGNSFFPDKNYKNYIKELLKENYFVHFAGNYPIPNIN